MTKARKNNRNRPARTARYARPQTGQQEKSPNRRASASEPPPAYTPEQQERIQNGLRILARIIARAHLERRSELSSDHAPGPPSEGEPRE